MKSLDLVPYRLDFKPNWDLYFKDFDKTTQQHILSKLDKMKQSLQARGLHSSRYKVEELGGYRIAFIQDDENHVKHIHFIGTHKQYEKWYSGKE